MEEVLRLPARVPVSRKSPLIESNKLNKWGMGLKLAIREKAKELPQYHILVDNGGVNGKADDDGVIEVNTLGRWLFGVPGYKGHILVEGGEENIKVYLPEEAPTEAYELIIEAINTL